MKEYKYYYLFITSLIIIMIVPNLLQKGMFVDGLWYAVISENLTNNLGTFWKPVLTKTMSNPFYGHPPLVFGIQSLFFTFFGNELFVEKLYALFILIVTILMIRLLWKELFFNKKEHQKLWFIPVLLWFLSETIYLMYTNNLLECTQTIFIIASIITVLKGIRNDKYHYFFLAGIFIMLSFLSKGIAGIFPLITVFLFYFSTKEIALKKALLYSFVVILGFSTLFILFLIEPEACTNIKEYLSIQVIGSLKGENTNNFQTSRFYILKALLQVNIIPVALLIIFSLANYYLFKLKLNLFEYKKWIFFFLFLMLSGVLPIMIGKKQTAYYLITTIPFLAIALSLIFIQNKQLIQQLKTSKIFGFISLLLFVVSLFTSYQNIGKINRRDQDLLQDLSKSHFILKTNENTIVGADTKNIEHALYGYMMRYYKISLDTITPNKHKLLITNQTTKVDTFFYRKLNNSTLVFNLYEKNKAKNR